MGKQGKKKTKRKYNPKRHSLQPQRKPESPMRNKLSEINQLAAIIKGNKELISRAKEREAERRLQDDS